MQLKAVIFDLDGVLTDTAEYHYLAWKRLADEEKLPFDREMNEQLRGVSRRDSLLRILNGRFIPEANLEAMMARKNSYYVEMLTAVSPADLLPGVANLLDELDTANIPYGLASASRNAPDVVQRLGIAQRLACIADGSSVQQQKPAPHLFRYAAAKLNVPPAHCLVVEDAAAGIEAALDAGMGALALGPAGRFAHLAHSNFTRYNDLQGVGLADLQAAMRPDDEWIVGEEQFVVPKQGHKETIFTIGNGYFASRGSFEEGHPGESALTFAHGVFNDVPVFFTELANLPNWLDLYLAVNGEWFRLDSGELLSFRRWLNLADGILHRQLRWQSPGGVVVDLGFERFIAYTEQHLGGIRLVATAVNQPCTLTISAGINGHVANENTLHWHLLAQGQAENGVAWLQSQTRHTKIELGTAMKVETAVSAPVLCQNCPGHPILTVEQTLQPGETVQLDKLVSYVTSRDGGDVVKTAVGQLAVGQLAVGQLTSHTYNTLRQSHIAAWQKLWHDIDVIIEGDQEAQLATRFSLFQLQIAAPQHDNRVSIGAKTMSGLGYRGHVFWDTEIFILPFFIYTQPAVARNLLHYRYHTLDGARRKATGNGYGGAQFAWESAVTGDEVTPTWVPDPATNFKELIRIWTGDIEIHITADIAYAILQYWQATGDDAFLLDYGAEIILDGACFWGDRAEREEVDGVVRYALRDVIGPDEYHDHVDNNAYTNRMAQWHLQEALHLLVWLQNNHPAKAAQLTAQLDLTPGKIEYWQEIVNRIIISFDSDTGLFTQFDRFFDLKEVDWAEFTERTASMQSLLGIEGANQHQVIKQADVIMLLCLLRQEYGQKIWQTNWDTYMPITDHSYGSSLGPSFHAWAACEMERPEEAYEHFMLAARADIFDARGNAGDGIHAASAGGIWQALTFGFAGLRLTKQSYTVKPQLPKHWRRLSFKFYQHGRQHVVDVVNVNHDP